MNNKLEQKLEVILFYTAEAVSVKELAKILDVTEKEISEALDNLWQILSNRGIRLVRNQNKNDDEVLLATAPEYSEIIEKMIQEERSRDLGRASLETLSIIAYKGPVSKRDIEYIRGVNCDYAIRSLLLRGLVERTTSETDERVMLYTITSDTLLHLGLTKIEDLPEYTQMKNGLTTDL